MVERGRSQFTCALSWWAQFSNTWRTLSGLIVKVKKHAKAHVPSPLQEQKNSADWEKAVYF